MPRPKDLLRHLLLLCARVVSEESRRQIDFLLAENRTYRQLLGKHRILLNDDQRRLLAEKAVALGRQALVGSRRS